MLQEQSNPVASIRHGHDRQGHGIFTAVGLSLVLWVALIVAARAAFQLF